MASLSVGTFDTRTGVVTMACTSNNWAKGMSPPYWRINRAAWDEPRIAGFIMPGRVTLAPFKIGIKVQEGEASGKDGGKPVFRGMNLPRAQFTCEVDTGDDYFTMDAIVRTIMPVGVPTERDLYIVNHPTLARYRCNVCFCENIEETPPSNGGPAIFKLFLVCVFSRDNATHTPTKIAATSAGNSQAISLGGSVERLKDVRDRPPAGGGRPSTP